VSAGEGYVQFVTDPVDFVVEAALTVREESEPVLASADAWARVDVTRTDEGTDGETQWVEWELRPVESAVENETVPTINRGSTPSWRRRWLHHGWTSPPTTPAVLLDRLVHLESVVETCGGERGRRRSRRSPTTDVQW